MPFFCDKNLTSVLSKYLLIILDVSIISLSQYSNLDKFFISLKFCDLIYLEAISSIISLKLFPDCLV